MTKNTFNKFTSAVKTVLKEGKIPTSAKIRFVESLARRVKEADDSTPTTGKLTPQMKRDLLSQYPAKVDAAMEQYFGGKTDRSKGFKAMLNAAPEEVQIAAVGNVGYPYYGGIELIDNPSERVQMAVVDADPQHGIFKIKNPTPKVLKYAKQKWQKRHDDIMNTPDDRLKMLLAPYGYNSISSSEGQFTWDPFTGEGGRKLFDHPGIPHTILTPAEYKELRLRLKAVRQAEKANSN